MDSGQSTRMRLSSGKKGCRGSREEKIREGVSLCSDIDTWPVQSCPHQLKGKSFVFLDTGLYVKA